LQDDYKGYPTQPDNAYQAKPPPPAPTATDDASSYDIVKATQYGVYNRVVELIEGR
jgi:hypothetical protein